MTLVANILVAFVAFLHVWFLVLEMFLWTTPRVRRRFGLTEEHANATQGLARNQGLYNGFLAAGLVWSLFSANGFELKVFFLGCILIAGVYGGLMERTIILWAQALPAAIAFAAVLQAR